MIGRRTERPGIEDAGSASWQDDIDMRRAPGGSGKLKVFSVLGALFFALVGAGIYALTGWPWQGTGPAVAVPAQEPQQQARLQPQQTAAAQLPTPELRPVQPAAEPAPAVVATPAPAAAVPVLAPAAVTPPQQVAALPPQLPAPEPTPLPAAPPVAAAPPPQPAPLRPARPTAEEQAEARQFVQRAQQILERTSDIAAARLFLERAARLGDGDAAFRLAETFDPAWLARIGARGVAGDPARARALYQQALDRGVAAARERLAALR